MSRDEQGIEAAAGLDAEELSLLGRLRSIQRKIRQYKWSRWKRLDPFVENLFERTEKGRFLLGREAVLHDSTLVFGDVSIGEGSHVGQQVTLDGTGGLSIGRSCSIASGVRIQTHDSVRWALSGGKAAYEYAPVVIEDCCFIGANAVILRGVRVGAHSVVGAGAVVTRDVPAFSIAAGVPARVIGRVSLEGGKVELSYGGNA